MTRAPDAEFWKKWQNCEILTYQNVTFCSPSTAIKSFAPDVDIEENDDAYIVTMDAPGIEKGNVKVSLENGVLTIKGTREEINEEKEGDKVLRSERRQGSFQRVFSLPGPVDEASMKTELDNGILKITIKKAG